MKDTTNSHFNRWLLSSLIMLPVAPKVAALVISPGPLTRTSSIRFRKLIGIALSALLIASLMAFVMTVAANRKASTTNTFAVAPCIGLDVTNTSDSGPGSFRQAITDANTNAGLDTICFNIPAAGVQTIAPLSALPAITDPVIIDGYSQPGSSANTLAVGSDAILLIELNGASAGANGLHITAGSSTLRGLVINRVNGVGVRLESNGGNTIDGCYIGTNASGTANLSNSSNGVYVNGVANNLIGGAAPSARNVISGNFHGVQMTAGGATGNIVQGNYLGTDKTGTASLGNTPGDGVVISGGAGNNTIGGTASGAGNVISGNGQDGVLITDSPTGNTVQGNLIGTDATGTLDRGNARYGVIIRSSSIGNSIGGALSGARNVISGNDLDGITIIESADNNTVQGNYIGTDVTGTADLGNSNSGIRFDGFSSNTTIGGTTAGARNVISGNNEYGIRLIGSTGTQILGNFIGTNASGTGGIENSECGIDVNAGTVNLIIGGAVSTTPGGACTGACNLVSGNRQNGIQHGNGGATTIQGNYVGTDVNGTADLGNGSVGINLVSGAAGDTIGGLSPAARNVISGNNASGVNLGGGGGNTLLGNYIGLNSAGTAALGNTSLGVLMGSSGNTVGGTASGAGNVISGHSGNDQSGVQVSASNNAVQGNFIGTNAAGTAALGNQTGILISGNSTNATIGGTTPGARNVISGNTADGIVIGRPNSSSSQSSNNNTVQGNYIGISADGTADLGNAGNGVVVQDSSGNTIGGTTVGARNVISGNNASGVRVTQIFGGTTGNALQGNYIGTNAAGTSGLGNSASGVAIDNVSTNTIGGPTAAEGNLIAFNTGDGVFVNSGTGNPIRANSIFSNNELGIDLSPNGVTPNDSCDADPGANNLQNFPVVTSAFTNGGTTTIDGTLDSISGETFTIEFFSNTLADPSGNGEGETFVESTTVTLDAGCSKTFSFNTASPLISGLFVTATATDSAGNTSELGPNRMVTSPTAANSTISGTIVDNQGMGVAGVVINLSGTQNRMTITNAKGGYYLDAVETSGFYTVTPVRPNYSFTPALRSFNQLGNHTEAGFNASRGVDVANPLDTAEFFVRQQYVDILGREPDEGGFNYWSNEINRCGSDAVCVNARRRDIAAAFFIEQEFQQTGSYIYNLYSGALGRKPRYVEYASDRQQVVGGANLEAEKAAFAARFVQRADFVQRYETNTTAESFVAALLQTVQQAAGVDLSGQRASLISAYVSGPNIVESRSLVLRSVADNSAFTQAEYNAAFVLTEYFGYLKRDPEQGGYDFWLNVLNNQEPGNHRGMICAFITSAEYQQRFSQVMTHTNAECGR